MYLKKMGVNLLKKILSINNKNKMEGENYKNFDLVVSKMRSFFKDVKGFVEVHTQNKKSILAACEDPKTIATYNYEGQIWPLPQTGQMLSLIHI